MVTVEFKVILQYSTLFMDKTSFQVGLLQKDLKKVCFHSEKKGPVLIVGFSNASRIKVNSENENFIILMRVWGADIWLRQPWPMKYYFNRK